MARRKKSRKYWAYSVGRYGTTVRIYEPRKGAPLRWAYREGDRLVRPQVEPLMRVRIGDLLDPVAVRRAEELCERKAASMALEPLRHDTVPARLTLGDAYAMYFDPRRRALPASRSGRIHHTSSRTFWCERLGEGALWDAIRPGDVWAGLLDLRDAGRVSTAEKRHDNLRTLYRWLRDRMGFETIRNPLRGLDKRKLLEGYEPRRPRYTDAQIDQLIEAAPGFGPRFALFTVLLGDSGARSIQVRHAMRSGLDVLLEPPPPADHAPHGWLVMPAVKGQRAMVTYLTARQRKAIDAALAGYLSAWEAEWQEAGADYPLVPGGRDDRELVREPISDTALRKLWPKVEKKAGLEPKARRGFHGVRRGWSDNIEEGEGLDTVTAAGGWSRRETPEMLYLSRRRYQHLERARRRRERGS